MRLGFIALNQNKYNFYSHAVKYSSSESLGGHLLMLIAFHVDDEIVIYERQVFNVLDMFGLLGGLYEIFELLGGFLLSSFSRTLMYNFLFKQLYHVKENYHESNDITTMKTMNKVTPISLNFRPNSELKEESK